MRLSDGHSPRICLVVDHPDRDLDGLVLLATRLAGLGAEAFLVPLYHLYEIPFLAPDFVVLNYLRPSNRWLARFCGCPQSA